MNFTGEKPGDTEGETMVRSMQASGREIDKKLEQSSRHVFCMCGFLKFQNSFANLSRSCHGALQSLVHIGFAAEKNELFRAIMLDNIPARRDGVMTEMMPGCIETRLVRSRRCSYSARLPRDVLSERHDAYGPC